jgi:hypothetical protein
MNHEERNYLLDMYKGWLGEELSPDQLLAALCGRWADVSPDAAAYILTKQTDPLFVHVGGAGLFARAGDHKTAFEIEAAVSGLIQKAMLWKHEHYAPKIEAEAVRAKQAAGGAKSKRSADYLPLLEHYHRRYPDLSLDSVLDLMVRNGDGEFEEDKFVFTSDAYPTSTDPKAISTIRSIWSKVKKSIAG